MSEFGGRGHANTSVSLFSQSSLRISQERGAPSQILNLRSPFLPACPTAGDWGTGAALLVIVTPAALRRRQQAAAGLCCAARGPYWVEGVRAPGALPASAAAAAASGLNEEGALAAPRVVG